MATDLRQLFEYDLLQKLSIRVKQNTSGMMFLVNCFKFFDLSNSGKADIKQWVRTFGKIGLNGFTNEDWETLFKEYDVQGRGSVDYKSFSIGIYGEGPRSEEGGGENYDVDNKAHQLQQQGRYQHVQGQNNQTPGNVNTITRMTQREEPHRWTTTSNETGWLGWKQRFDTLLLLFQNNINKYNGLHFYTLLSTIKAKEDKNTHKIPFSEISKLLPWIKIDIPQREQNEFYSLLDINRDGLAMSDDFLGLIRGEMNEKRRNALINVFSAMDTTNEGMIDVQTIKQRYNTSNHPEVTSGRIKNPQDVYDAFVYAFDIYCNCKGVSTRGDPSFRIDNFLDFYSGISASIDDDDYFIDIIRNVWMSPPSHRNWERKMDMNSMIPSIPQRYTNEQRQKTTPIVDPTLTSQALDKLKKIISLRGNQGIVGLLRAARTFSNNNNDNFITITAFEHLNNTLCLGLSPGHIRSLCLECPGDTINFIDLFRAIYGEMNEFRKNVVLQAFKSLDIANKNTIDLNEIRNRYDAKNHPDVLAREKSADEVYVHFLDSLQTFLFYIGKVNVFCMDREEFFELYNILSMNINDDRRFEMIVKGTWRIR